MGHKYASKTTLQRRSYEKVFWNYAAIFQENIQDEVWKLVGCFCTPPLYDLYMSIYTYNQFHD